MSSEPIIDFIFRGFPVLIPDTAEKKSYLFLDQLLLTFSDGLIFLYFQNFLTGLDLYFCKEFLLPLLSGLLAVVGLMVSFYLLYIYLTILLAFSFYLFFDTVAKVRCTPYFRQTSGLRHL